MKNIVSVFCLLMAVHVAAALSPSQTDSQRGVLLMNEEQLRERVRVHDLPKYPVKGPREQSQGSVVVEIQVDQEGLVRNVEVLEASQPLFAAATVKALKQWKLRPVITPKGESFGAKGKLTFYFYFQKGRGWVEDPLIFKHKGSTPNK